MINILFGLFVAAVIGHQITAVWQMRNWKEQQKILEKKERYDRRINLLDQLSEITISRYHQSIVYLDTLTSNDSEKIEKSRDMYKKSVTNYNLQFPVILNKMKALFSVSHAFEYDKFVPHNFVKLEGELRNLREKYEKGSILNYSDGRRVRLITPPLRKFCVNYFSELYKKAEFDFTIIHSNPYKSENLSSVSYFEILKRIFNI